MFFLFAVAYSNANFQNTEVAFPDTFNPERVVAALDNTANAYSKVVAYDVVEPWQQSYAIMKDNVDYIIDNSDEQILALTGLSSLASVPETNPASAQVAGAFTQQAYSDYYPGGGFNVRDVYAWLMQ